MKFPKQVREQIGMDVEKYADPISVPHLTDPGDFYINMVFYNQKHHNACTNAALKMVLKQQGYDDRADAINLQEAPKFMDESRNFFGGSMKEAAEAAGVKDKLISISSPGKGEWTISNLKPELVKKGPLLASIQTNAVTGHAIVVMGVSESENCIYIHDPWKGPSKQRSIDWFNAKLKAEDADGKQPVYYLLPPS
jgi:hypothetical protein